MPQIKVPYILQKAQKFDFSTLYNTIPYSKLKQKYRALVIFCLLKKDDKRINKYLVQGRDTLYFIVNQEI